MYFQFILIVAVLCNGFRVVCSTCTSDNDEKICVAPNVMRALMKINDGKGKMKDVSDNKIKPAFFALLKTPSPFTLRGINDVVKFDDVKINRGGGYDSSTGYFTAPRQGLYQISCMLLGWKSGTDVHFQLNKNNALYVTGYLAKTDLKSQTISALVAMKKGDRVFIKHRTSSSQKIHGSHHSTFSGYFVYE